MVVLTAKYFVKAGRGNEVAAALRRMAPLVKASEPGCVIYHANRATENPDLFLLYEHYVDQGYRPTQPTLAFQTWRELAEGGYIERSEPVVLIGDCGTGKTHLATGLCLAACRQKRRARFTTAAGLVNELVEAKQHNQVKRVMAKWMKYDLIVLDEVGYVPLADIGAEFLFQVISERAERAAWIVTTNLPFSEWTSVFPNPRLCKALLDRVTDRAHIIETGTESYRFRRTLEEKKKRR